MKRFCENCGAEILDDSVFCPNCGARSDNGAQASAQSFQGAQNVQNVYAPQDFANAGQMPKTPANKNLKTLIIAAVAVVAVVVIAIVAGVTITSNTGAKGELKKVMNAIKDYDIDTLVDESSDIYYDYYSDPEDELEDLYESQVGYIIDQFEDKFGSSYKFSYTSELSEMSTRQFEKTMNSLSRYETDWIDNISTADVTITATSNGKTKTQKLTVYLSKESDGWKLLLLEINY